MPWLTPMGSRFALLFAAPLLLAAPVLAQQENSAENSTGPVFNLPRTTQPQTTQPDKQGPELDVFRGTPATVTPPPPITPAIQLPPPVVPAAQPAQTRPATPAPRPQRAPTTHPQGQPAPITTTPPPASQPAPTPPAPQTQPLPAVDNGAAPAPLAPVEEKPSWPWIAAAGAGLLALIAAALWLRRRKQAELDDLVAYEPEPEPVPAEPAPEPAPAAPQPAAPPSAPATADRPWLDFAMEVQAARLTLMGATIGYVLTLHNRGNRPAEDILIRSLIANADAQQQPLFQQFFAGETGLPVHSAVAIAPGETQRVTGELRLGPEEIAAIPMGHRALLIPLIAFDAQYRWTNEAGETDGTGRTGRAFIIGEEQTPPVERLSPFRLDLGPRQYRTPGSRATALSLAS